MVTSPTALLGWTPCGPYSRLLASYGAILWAAEPSWAEGGRLLALFGSALAFRHHLLRAHEVLLGSSQQERHCPLKGHHMLVPSWMLGGTLILCKGYILGHQTELWTAA